MAPFLIGGMVLAGIAPHAHAQRYEVDPLSLAYHEYCGVCHGENLEGTAQGTPLAGVALRYGDSAGEIGASIANGFPTQGMPGWSEILPEAEIRELAIYIADLRANVDRWDTRRDMPLVIPEGTVASELHDFRIDRAAGAGVGGLMPANGTRAPLLIGAAVLAAAGPHIHAQRHAIDPLSLAYHEYCGVCHGENLEGTAQGTPLAGVALRYGDSAGEIGASIASGFPAQGMPGWSGILPETEIRKLAMYVSERRVNLDRQDTRRDMALAIPDGTVASALHDFRIESFAQGSDPHPFSIASLPDGRFLLTEKKRGLRIVSANGVVAPFVEGTPKTYAQDDPDDRWANPQHGVGWLLDVAAHPDYERNGWIYLQFGDRCSDCNASGGTVSMNRLVRGRIEDGRWIDEETLWRADLEDYTWRSDMGAGGRICFDGDGHVFLSIGVKGLATHLGIQDLSKPYGKVHRMRDDGRVPADNPFVDLAGALPTIWTYGHRSPQGLEFNRHTERLWSTEMGPRGGDEINLLLPGRNYGWPLTSRGVEYDGTPVEYGEDLGITFALEDIEQPVVDLTPSPAVSSFVFYDGDAFPAWRNHMLVGSLRGADLFRVQVDGDRFVGKETLIEDLARIRDIEVGFDGLVYLVLEHATGWAIVRLAPVMEGTTALRDPLAEVRHESAWRRSPGRPPADP